MKKVITYPIGADFIENLAEYLFRDYYLKGKKLEKLALVFGGRRPALFLKKALAARIKKAFRPPIFFAIEEFVDRCLMGEFSGRLPELEADYLIYELVKNNFPAMARQRDFPAFLSWAREIKGFIEQLDLEDIKEEALSEIRSSARIGYDVPVAVKKLLENIISLRKKFHRVLAEKKVWPRGYRYLKASEIVEKLTLPEFEEIFFCNFFHLHATETKIIKSFFKRGEAQLILQGTAKDWDALKKIGQDFSVKVATTEESSSSADIKFYSCSNLLEEVGVLKEIIKEIPVGKKEETLVVLPDETSLVPVLSEISAFAGEYNVSLGYPLKRSALVFLLKSIFQAQLTRKGEKYYTKDYLKVLNHPLTKNSAIDGLKSQPAGSESAAISRILIHKIEEIILGIGPFEKNVDFAGVLFIEPAKIENCTPLFEAAASLLFKMGHEISLADLKDVLTGIHRLFFYDWEAVNSLNDFATCLENLINQLLKWGLLDDQPLNLLVAEKLLDLAADFKKISFSPAPLGTSGILKIFEDILEKEVVSFSGSPLKGLQILGFLETRSLNFKNVIFMDLNEAVLPRLKVVEPLIPEEVMVSLGITSLEKEEEVQRYHFSRLILGAEKVFLIYQENDEKEKSRFVEELICREQKAGRCLRAAKVVKVSFPVAFSPISGAAAKSRSMVKFLKTDFVYSASSLDTYLMCPLRFYFQYILGLEEKEELSEEAEGSKIGTFIHELLKETFEVFAATGRKPVIDAEFEKMFFDSFERRFAEKFEKTMKSDSFLLKEIMLVRLKDFLKNEAARPVEKIIYLEKSIESKISLGAGRFPFKIIVDRLDLLPDKTHLIIDYKTGSTANHKPKKLDKLNWASRQELKKSLKSFQLPLYYYFLEKEFINLNAGLYGLRDASIEYLFKDESAAERKELIDRKFIPALNFIISEINDEKILFSADFEDVRYCENCPYGQMCR